jgi:hypothetical protein
VVLAQALEILEEAGPALATEAIEPTANVIGSALAMGLPVFKPTLTGLIDLNKDGKIG